MSVLPTHLSIIITTSPIHSHPDTQLIDDSINSILIQPTLEKVHIYIVCDGAKVNAENQYKSGAITEESYKRYLMFKEALHKKYNDKNKYTIVERETKFGFAENIKFIMEEYAKTEHVLIYQHDHVMEKIIDFGKVMEILQKNVNQINYLTFMHKSYNTLIDRQLQYPKVKAYLLKLLQKEEHYNYYLNKEDFKASLILLFENQFELPLVPLNFWYDKVHIAKREYYLNIIFNKEGNFDYHKNKFIKTISFVEDTFGHCMKSTIAEFPEKILEYGAYVFWDVEPVFYHQSGRPFITKEQRENYQKEGRKEAEKLDLEEEFEVIEGIDLDKISEIEMNTL